MAEDIQVASYRVVALTYKGGGVDLLGVLKSSRVALIYSDAPTFRMASYRNTALTAFTRNPDLSGLVKVSRFALLYADAPTFRMASYRNTALTAFTRNPDLTALVKSARMGFIIRPPSGFIKTGRLAFIIEQAESGPAAYVQQAFQKVHQKEDWPSLADTVSDTRTLQVFEKVVLQEVYGMPWSQTRVVSEMMNVLLQTPSPFAQSMTRSISEVMQVLQSDIHQHISVSMDYVLSEAMQIVQQTPMTIWQSPHYAMSVAQWALYRTPMGFLPRSTTSAFQVAFKVLQHTEEGYLPWSDVHVNQVAVATLFDYVSPVPDQGTNEVFQETMMALQRTDGEPLIVGPDIAGQYVMSALQESVYPFDVSVTSASSLVELVLSQEHYDSPRDIGKTNASQSVLKVAVSDAGYQNPDVMQSQSRVYQNAEVVLQQSTPAGMPQGHAVVPQAHLEWLQWTSYPLPGDMIPPDKAALVGQLNITTLQHADYSPVQSATRALQLAQLTSQYLFYTPASDMAEKGIFIGQLAEAVARNTMYPDPAEPISPVYTDQISVMTAYTDDTYPDPTKEAQPGETFQVVETVASEVEYPDPAVSAVWAEVTQAAVQYSSDVTFPDPTVPVSSVTLTQISIQGATNADYPDPVSQVSPAEVSQALEQVSQSTTYPNPANPASTLTVNQTLQMVAIPDVTLHGVPDYEIKHRPIITISIVYIQTS